MDGQQQGIRRRRWGMAMAATLIGTGVSAFAMAGTAQADLERADQRCFTVAGGWKGRRTREPHTGRSDRFG